MAASTEAVNAVLTTLSTIQMYEALSGATPVEV